MLAVQALDLLHVLLREGWWGRRRRCDGSAAAEGAKMQTAAPKETQPPTFSRVGSAYLGTASAMSRGMRLGGVARVWRGQGVTVLGVGSACIKYRLHAATAKKALYRFLPRSLIRKPAFLPLLVSSKYLTFWPFIFLPRWR